MDPSVDRPLAWLGARRSVPWRPQPARPGEADWTGAPYGQVQRRHPAISRRYFSRLIGEAGR
jgi:hypothetical protein